MRKPEHGPCVVCGRETRLVRWKSRGKGGQNGVAPTYVCPWDCKGVRDAD